MLRSSVWKRDRSSRGVVGSRLTRCVRYFHACSAPANGNFYEKKIMKLKTTPNVSIVSKNRPFSRNRALYLWSKTSDSVTPRELCSRLSMNFLLANQFIQSTFENILLSGFFIFFPHLNLTWVINKFRFFTRFVRIVCITHSWKFTLTWRKIRF